jgi:hypothetical protein
MGWEFPGPIFIIMEAKMKIVTDYLYWIMIAVFAFIVLIIKDYFMVFWI